MDKKQLKEKYKTVDDLVKRIDEIKGNSFGMFDVNKRLSNPDNKGALGQIVEEGIFGYSINSNPSADFDYLGLELKTTGVIQNANSTISAKERLPLDNLNYEKVARQSFEESDMWIKNKGLFLVLYKYTHDTPYSLMPIIKGFAYRFPLEDLEIIMQDYEKISNIVKSGKAEMLSESDTLYLGACTAGSNANDLTKQPFSDVMAKRRKFCLKQSYMTQIIRNNISYSEVEHIVSYSEIKNTVFETFIYSKLDPYIGKSEAQLQQIFGIESTSKAKFERYIAAMLGIKGKVNNTDEFLKANIELKTIRVEESGNIKENMSFPYFTFKDVATINWFDSDFYNLLESRKFLFAIFKKHNDEFYFEGIKFWHMPIDILDNQCREIYEETAKILRAGDVVKNIKVMSNGKTIRITNFPGMSFNGVMHVRPHGRDSLDVDDLPVEDKFLKSKKFTKQCFWLNSTFIKKIINDKM